MIGPEAWPRTNTLLNPWMVLAKACWLMRQRAVEPCETTVRMAFPFAAWTYAIDDFTPEYLQPAIDAAVLHPLTGPNDGNPHLPEEWHWCHSGIDAYQRLCHDIDCDTYQLAIDMRIDAPKAPGEC